MNAGYVQYLRGKLAATRELVAEYVIALKVAEREATPQTRVSGQADRAEADVPPRRTFKESFAARRATRKGAASARVAHRRGSKASPGALRVFLVKHADLNVAPSAQAKGLLRLARSAGIPTTVQSIANGISAMRHEKPNAISESVLDHLRAFGPLSYESIHAWLVQEYPDTSRRKTVGVLMSLKMRQSAAQDPLGEWRALKS